VPTAEQPVDEQLRSLLRAEPPPSILALPERSRAELARVIADARRRQAAELVASYDAALRHVPAPVRRLVKKVLGG
jgi:hypothetical protein